MKKTIPLCWTKQAAMLLVFLAVHYISEHMGDSAVSLLPNMKVGWLPAVMAGVSAAGQIFGGIFGNNAARRAKRKQMNALNEKQRKLDAWRDEQLGSDYLSRADSQAVLRNVQENIDDALKATNNTAIKGGMTDEARAAYASRLNRGYADAVSQIAGLGEKYRDQIRDSYLQQSSAIDDAKMGLEASSAANSVAGAQNFASGIASAAGALSSLMGGGATTMGVQPSATVQNMAKSGYLPGDPIVANRYKINI